MKLNLGCCDAHIAGWLNVDIVPPADQIADLNERWPWDDSTIEQIRAHDIFEHLYDKRHTINECWRVLVSGGKLEIEVPSASKGDGGFCDPTHCSYWTTSDFEYYEKGNPARERFRPSEFYGVKADFRVLSVSERKYQTKWGGEVFKITAILEATK